MIHVNGAGSCDDQMPVLSTIGRGPKGEQGDRGPKGDVSAPIFADPIDWDIDSWYQPFTIVLHNGDSYTSKKLVPIGISISNEEYWAHTGDYNAQVEEYRQQVISKAFAFDTVADMKTSNELYVGAICHTNGFYEISDGGASWYVINDTGIPNEMDILACENGLYAKLVHSDTVNVDCIGAKHDGTDDSAYFKRAFEIANFVEANGNEYTILNTVTIPIGAVLQTPRNVMVVRGCKLLAGNNNGSILKLSQGSIVRGIWLHDSRFDSSQNYGSQSTCKAINAYASPYAVVENCRITGFDYGIDYSSNSWCTKTMNCIIERCNKGIRGSGEFNSANIENNTIFYCGTGIETGQGRCIKIDGCTIEHCSIGVSNANIGSISITNTYFELNYDYSIQIQWGLGGTSLATIEHCSFLTNEGFTTHHIQTSLSSGAVVTIRNNIFLFGSQPTTAYCIKLSSANTAPPYFYQNRLIGDYSVSEDNNYYDIQTSNRIRQITSCNDAPIGICFGTNIQDGPENDNYGVVFTYYTYWEARKVQLFLTPLTGRMYLRTFNFNTNPQWSTWKQFSTVQ